MKKRSIIIMVLCLILLIPCFAYADTGPKPSININIKNPPDEDYVLDIIEKQNHPDDNRKSQDRTDISDDIWQKLLNYNDNGWMSASIFDFLCHNSLHQSKAGSRETFKYTYRPPQEFRIIVVTKSGDIKVSDTIVKKSFFYTCTYDYSTNKVTISLLSSQSTTALIISFLITLGLTFIIEILISLPFSFNPHKKVQKILIVNTITQIILYAVILIYYSLTAYPDYITIFSISEIFIIAIEALIYIKLFKGCSKKSIITYTVIANLVSGPLVDLAIFYVMSP